MRLAPNKNFLEDEPLLFPDGELDKGDAIDDALEFLTECTRRSIKISVKKKPRE